MKKYEEGQEKRRCLSRQRGSFTSMRSLGVGSLVGRVMMTCVPVPTALCTRTWPRRRRTSSLTWTLVVSGLVISILGLWGQSEVVSEREERRMLHAHQ